MPLAKAPTRFLDDGRRVIHFFERILVTCPECSRAAQVTRIAEPEEDFPLYAPRRLTCFGCGYYADRRGNNYSQRNIIDGAVVDPYFEIPLWLQMRTRHGLVYAYNAQHLEWLESFVAADLRERRQSDDGWVSSMASRLPRWVKAASNREEVLRSLTRLRRRLAAAGTSSS